MKKVFGFIVFAMALVMGIYGIHYIAWYVIPMWKMYIFNCIPTTEVTVKLMWMTVAYVFGLAAPTIVLYLGGKKLWKA